VLRFGDVTIFFEEPTHSVPVKQASEDEVVVAVTFFFATPRSEEVGETAGEFLLAPPVT
jgi:hypothetical protein